MPWTVLAHNPKDINLYPMMLIEASKMVIILLTLLYTKRENLSCDSYLHILPEHLPEMPIASGKNFNLDQ